MACDFSAVAPQKEAPPTLCTSGGSFPKPDQKLPDEWSGIRERGPFLELFLGVLPEDDITKAVKMTNGLFQKFATPHFRAANFAPIVESDPIQPPNTRGASYIETRELRSFQSLNPVTVSLDGAIPSRSVGDKISAVFVIGEPSNGQRWGQMIKQETPTLLQRILQL
jgi:hypothetical protein